MTAPSTDPPKNMHWPEGISQRSQCQSDYKPSSHVQGVSYPSILSRCCEICFFRGLLSFYLADVYYII